MARQSRRAFKLAYIQLGRRSVLADNFQHKLFLILLGGSTLLSDQQFERLTSWMGEPMRWLGISPETKQWGWPHLTPRLMTRNAGHGAAMVNDRRVLLYGVAPRLVVLLVSHFKLKHAEANVRLDTTASWYATLRQSLMGTPVFTAITDADQSVVSQLQGSETPPARSTRECCLDRTGARHPNQ